MFRDLPAFTAHQLLIQTGNAGLFLVLVINSSQVRGFQVYGPFSKPR